MTARERFELAFSSDGNEDRRPPVVVSYDSVFVRDHWSALTREAWWYAYHGEASHETAWASDYAERSGLEWITVRPCRSREERAESEFEQRADEVWLVNRRTGARTRLTEPVPAGTNTSSARPVEFDPARLPATPAEVDALIPTIDPFDRNTFLAEGRHDAALAISRSLDVVPYVHVSSPVWALYSFMGYEGMMTLLAGDPELASYAAERLAERSLNRIAMAKELGAGAVWIEECLTDQISPRTFEDVSLPLVTRCVDAVREAGMWSVYYYCGNPNDRLDLILAAGADAVHFEESKKDFVIDIADIVARVDGSCTVFGNIDSVGMLSRAPRAVLEREIVRQVKAGRRNGGRFVMSTGSPVTPDTSVERVRAYADIVRGTGI